MRPLRRSILSLLVVLAALPAACGGGGDAEGSESGVLPATIPEGFPIPAGSRFGSSSVDEAHGRTEFEFTAPMRRLEAVTFFTVEFVSAGFVVERSAESGADWLIDFRRGLLSGSVLLSGDGGSVSGAVTIIDP
jgi:hypothetical protein